MNTLPALITAVLLVCATASPLQAGTIKFGRYKGTCVFTQTLTESGAVVKRTFPVSGRIRGNNSFIFISPPIGISDNQLDGRFFSGTVVPASATFTFITGTDVDGTTFTGVNLPATFTGDTLKLVWSYNLNLGAIPGDSVNKRVFVLKRVGD